MRVTEKATDSARRRLGVTISVVLTVTATVALRLGGGMAQGETAAAATIHPPPAVMISAHVNARGLEIIVDWCGGAPLVPTSRQVTVDDAPVPMVDWRAADAHGSCAAAAVSQVRLDAADLPDPRGPLVIGAGICDARGRCGRAEIVRFVRSRTETRGRNR